MLKQIITCCCCLKCTYAQHAVRHVTVGSQNITTEDVSAGFFYQIYLQCESWVNGPVLGRHALPAAPQEVERVSHILGPNICNLLTEVNWWQFYTRVFVDFAIFWTKTEHDSETVVALIKSIMTDLNQINSLFDEVMADRFLDIYFIFVDQRATPL